MAESLVWMTVALMSLVVVLAAVSSYRRRARRAQARSRAALNRLLAEADEIEQQARAEAARAAQMDQQGEPAADPPAAD